HTTDTVSAVAALALGARYFEKHITLDHTQDGPDHPFALEPGQMRTYADNLRDIDLATRGDGFSAPSQRELVNRAAYVKSLIARRDLPVGHVLSDADVYLARPGHGIPPFEMDLAMGRTLARPIAAETPLCWADLEKGD
ncbi:MAG: N-acetylneuraminate synthase family protein, partial [Rhodospirillales bacterium]|nr:N-acetylneuraminate synthase family protein [Rhodospirillales bacterium]